MALADILVDQILEHLLAAGIEARRRDALSISIELGEGDLAGLNLLADTAVPGRITLGDELIHLAVLDDGMRDFEAASERIHPADVGVEKIDGLVGFATTLGIEVKAALREAAHLEDAQHDISRQVKVRWELVRIPAKERVAAISVD